MSFLQTALNTQRPTALELVTGNKQAVYANGHFRELVRRATPVVADDAASTSTDRVYLDRGYIDLIQNAMDRTKPNGEDFNVQLNDLAEVYLKPAVARINTLRHRIIPFIREIVSDIEQTYTESIVLTPEVREVKVPKLYTSGEVYHLTKRHGELGIFGTKNINLPGGFMDRNEEDILVLLKTGSTVFNDGLLDIVASYPNGWLKSVYDKYMLTGNVIPAVLEHSNYIGYLDEALMIYIIVGNMVNQEIVDGTVNLSFDQYKKVLTDIYALLGGFLNRYAARLATIIKDGEIVQWWDRDNNVVHVYEPTFQSFLEQKGDVDALLGALYTTGPRVFMGNLLRDGQRLAANWNQTYQQLLKEREVKFVADVRALFGKALMEKLPKQDSKLIALFAADLPNPVDVLNVNHTHYVEITNMILANYNNVASKDLYLSISSSIINCPFMAKNGFKELYFAIDRKIAEAEKNDIVMPPQHAAFFVMAEEITKAILHGSINLVPKA